MKNIRGLKNEGFLSTSQNQGVNKSKYFCRKVKVPASEMDGNVMEAPALQCNKIYCRGQTKAEEFMVSPAKILLGWKLWCYFYTLSTSWWQKISCKPRVYRQKLSPTISTLRRKGSFLISLTSRSGEKFALGLCSSTCPWSQTL